MVGPIVALLLLWSLHVEPWAYALVVLAEAVDVCVNLLLRKTK